MGICKRRCEAAIEGNVHHKLRDYTRGQAKSKRSNRIIVPDGGVGGQFFQRPFCHESFLSRTVARRRKDKAFGLTEYLIQRNKMVQSPCGEIICPYFQPLRREEEVVLIKYTSTVRVL